MATHILQQKDCDCRPNDEKCNSQYGICWNEPRDEFETCSDCGQHNFYKAVEKGCRRCGGPMELRDYHDCQQCGKTLGECDWCEFDPQEPLITIDSQINVDCSCGLKAKFRRGEKNICYDCL